MRFAKNSEQNDQGEVSKSDIGKMNKKAPDVCRWSSRIKVRDERSTNVPYGWKVRRTYKTVLVFLSIPAISHVYLGR